MFHAPDLSEVAFAGDYCQPRCYTLEHNDVRLDEFIRLHEDLLAATDSDYLELSDPADE